MSVYLAVGSGDMSPSLQPENAFQGKYPPRGEVVLLTTITNITLLKTIHHLGYSSNKLQLFFVALRLCKTPHSLSQTQKLHYF